MNDSMEEMEVKLYIPIRELACCIRMCLVTPREKIEWSNFRAVAKMTKQGIQTMT